MYKFLLLLFGLLLSCPFSALAGAAVGSAAPDFSLQDMQGRQVRLSDLRGKVVIVNFWATWCPPCRAEMPSMETLYQTFKNDDLVLLALNVEEDGRELIEKFLQESPYSFPILLDSETEVQQRYGVFQFPESFIIDRNGVVVKKVIGAVHWMDGDLYRLLHFMVKG
jgi:peroxiredoxin